MTTTMTSQPATTSALRAFLAAVAQVARDAGVFAGVEVLPAGVVCEARGSAAAAQYRVSVEKGRLYVELTTPDRWLSHSIEADLLNTGDKIEELVDEELVELGAAPIHVPLGAVRVEHYRNDAKLFVFRSALPSLASSECDLVSTEIASRMLLAYEACFRELGDMNAGGAEA
jgi:hypothetical protein